MGIKKVMEKKIIKWKLWGILIIALLMAGGAMMHITAVDVHAAVKNGWVTKKGVRYYYRDGRKVRGEWIQDKNKWYYLKPEKNITSQKKV